MADVKFTKQQQKAYDLMVKGENVFITGPSGTGKSLIINTFQKYHSIHKNIAITSTTGISALLIGGTTLHSFLGIGLGNGSVDELVKKIMRSKKAVQRWKNTDVLIIDEISMLSPELFDKLEEIARIIRRPNPMRILDRDILKEYPFGGIQLVLSGDFLQLPVVGEGNFCFESKSWNKCVPNVIQLDEIMRQTDPDFQEVLNDLRFGDVSERAKKLLTSRMKVSLKNDVGIKPTRIYTTNFDVDSMNNKELDKLDDELYQYDMDIHFYKYVPNKSEAIEKYKKNCIAPQSLQLCKGAQVMLLINLDLDMGLVNGSRGVVTSFFNDLPIVKFANGEELNIGYHSWEIEEEHKKFVRITQIPLKLAWAVTVHKCVNGNTIIPTDCGLVRIKNFALINQKQGEIRDINLNVQGIKGIEKCSQVFKGEIEDTITITTTGGFRIEGSYRHPVLTENNIWKKLPEIKIGDKIFLKQGTASFGNFVKTDTSDLDNIPEYIDEELSYLLGILCARAYYTLDSIELNLSQSRVVNNIQRIMHNIFGESFKIEYYEIQNIYMLSLQNKMIRDFITWCGGYLRKVPWCILQNTEKCQKSFLRALFDLYYSNLEFNTSSLDFASDIQILLLNIGIISSVKQIYNYERVFESYTLTIDRKDYESLSESKEIETKLFTEEVCKIEKTNCQVYDIYVPDSNTFIGNGIVNHNSQGATLDLAEISLANTFEYGQAYVALSRVKNKEGLKILDINFDSIQANPKAVKFYKTTE
jgi:ATP-dependent DNA helicase PIF1